jgi:hypothetical protein
VTFCRTRRPPRLPVSCVSPRESFLHEIKISLRIVFIQYLIYSNTSPGPLLLHHALSWYTIYRRAWGPGLGVGRSNSKMRRGRLPKSGFF